jgi:class 3 adenylate cyclase/tetratricopeptide (TPR) repeat protein
MAHLDNHSPSSSPPGIQSLDLDVQRVSRYLPPDLAAELLRDLNDLRTRPKRLVEAFVHLASARSVIATYLPRLLSSQLLHERLESPWLRWVEGSLLFADLSGSTALAERLSRLGREGTEMVTAFLNQIFTTLIQVIQDYGGDLVSFGGDALLVFFGDDRHPRTAARAALALQDVMRDYVQEVPGVGSFPMHLHVGIESGRVAFVSAGGGDELHYSVLGATVNRVALAEGRALPNETVVGPQAWAALTDFATGEQVADGFYRISAMRAPARPHLPLADEPAISGAPEETIPQLLDYLDRTSRYIPAALLRRILAEPQLPQIEADLRPVTVLFAQVVGLDKLAETLPPTTAAQAIQAYVGTMHAAIEQFGGVVNKLDVADEGIRLVAIFGAPAAYEDHAERAARAALEMKLRIADCRLQIADYLDQSTIYNLQSEIIKQRIGLNLGTAFAGNVGSAVRKEYTVMGDAVNVAARVMSKAEWGQVWCSEATMQAIASRMDCDDRGSLVLKGKALPLQLFQLIGERELPTARAPDEGPLIGRDVDLAWLRQRLDAAMGGSGAAVRIVGEAGVGKSRLAAALLDEAAARGVRIIAAACFSYTASIPYAAWAEWLKSLCGIVSGDGNELREHKIVLRLAQLGPGMDAWLPLLGDLARLDVPENRLTRGLDPQMRQTRRFELLEQLLLRTAADGPVLALFEDLHWADPISLDLWRRVAGALAGRPVLLLGVHRPARALEAGDGAQVLELKELSSDQSGSLVAALSGGVALPEPLLRKLVERAAGNPLFLAELLRAVVDKLQISDFRSQIEQQEQSAIYNLQSAIEDLPESLNGLLLARIDRLDENSRSILRVASVIGQRIPFGVLQSIQSFDQQVLLRELSRLDAENMTALERAEPERVHAFRHALIQEVAYQSMLYARRRELHGRIGEYLERRYGDDLDDYYGLLAHHYRLSDRRDKAIDYLQRAGQAAQAVYANEEALQYFAWALDALSGDDADPRAWAIRDALGDVYATVGRYDEALAQHTAILGAPGVTPDVARRAHRKRGNMLEKQGQYSAALEELDQAMAIARSGVAGISPLAIPLITADIGLVHRRRGEYDLAIAACEEGLRAIQDDPSSFEDEKIEARLHSELGGIYGNRGDYPRAREHFEHSLRLRTDVDDLPGMAASHNNLGYLWQLQSEYERAIEHYQVAEDLAKKINLRYLIVFSVGNAAYALMSQGDYAGAEARCIEVLSIAREMNAQHSIAQSHDMLALIQYYKGEYEQSLLQYNQALQIHRVSGSLHQEGSTLANIAMVLNAQGRFAEAFEASEQALEHADKVQAQRLKAEALNAAAEAMLGQHKLGMVEQYAREALAISEAIGSKHDGGIARRLLGWVAVERTQPFADDFDASIALFEAMQDRFELARTWAAYGIALQRSGNQNAARAYLNQAKDTFISIGANGELQRLALIEERSV